MAEGDTGREGAWMVEEVEWGICTSGDGGGWASLRSQVYAYVSSNH